MDWIPFPIAIICQETVWSCESCSVVSDSLQPHGLYSPWNPPGQNTGGGSLSLPQGIFPTQGSNPGLWHCRHILYQLSHQGSPKILEWVAYPFSRRSSRPRNQIRVSCIAGGFFTNWAMRDVPIASLIAWETFGKIPSFLSWTTVCSLHSSKSESFEIKSDHVASLLHWLSIAFRIKS